MKSSTIAQTAPEVTEIIEVTPEIEAFLSVLKEFERLDAVQRILFIKTFQESKIVLTMRMDRQQESICNKFFSIITSKPLLKRRKK